jgi:hypothetical protein
VPRYECKSSVLEAYWPNIHKPIYITFKLQNKNPIYSNKPILSQFI